MTLDSALSRSAQSRYALPLSLGAAALLFSACLESGSDDEPAAASSQEYVAVGNSLTAGFQSGGLRKDWQESSYPALIAKQMGIADFEIPVIDSPGIGREKTVDGKNTIPAYIDSSGGINTSTVLTVPASSLLSNRLLDRPYNNLGVPRATTWDFLHAYDSTSAQVSGNGFFNIVLRNTLMGNRSELRQAISLKPKILTMWVGNNDILGGVIDGTIVENQTVTPTATYRDLMDRALDTLLRETTAKIFLANIPSIITIPYVTAVPPIIVDATFKPVSPATPWLTEESDVKYVLLPALRQILQKNGLPTSLGGTGVKLAATLTLTTGEAALADKLTNEYNAYLQEKADENPTRIYLVDVNALLKQLTNGEIPDLNDDFALFDIAKKTAFSLDGIHPNSKGYKKVANLFLKRINQAMGTTYAEVP